MGNRATERFWHVGERLKQGTANEVMDGPTCPDNGLGGAGGLGDLARRMGIDPRDPKQWMALDRLALTVAARKHSWADWHGAARVGIPNGSGFGFKAPPPEKHETVVRTHVHVDRKTMAKVVTKHQTRMANLPNVIGSHDSFGSHALAGTTQVPG